MAKEIRFKRLGKYEELYSTDKRYIRLQGGAGSGKSQAIAQYLLIEALSDYRHNIFCFRKVARSTRNSLFALFKDLISEMGLDDHFRTNKTLQTVTCTATQVSIIMLGLDDVEKVKSIRNPSLIWMEEATEFSKADFTQLDLRVRNLGPKNQLILSYNPISTENFIYKDFELSGELKGKELFIKSTYKDNIFLTKEYKETLKGLATSNDHAYQVYTLGNWANLTEGLIFPSYEIVDFIPRYAKQQPYYGLDFGFTDPMALTQVGIWDGGLYMSELLYERNLTIPQLADKMKELGLGRNDLIYSDSANPSDIQQLYDLGYTGCKPARKGKDSIMSGIRMMNQYKLYVTSQSVNLISELNKYCWVTDKEGNALERPIDAFNHAIDSARYAVFTHNFEKAQPKYFSNPTVKNVNTRYR